jgi:excisionase family DNA binding protein
MFTTYPDVVNVNQLKDMLGIGITLAYRLVKHNNIKALKIGREYKIPKANIISYLVDENKP